MQADERPNILFIVADDLRPELGAYGYNGVHTPNIDAFAATGTTFMNAYVPLAVCGPSRAAMLSGLRPDSTGIYDNKTSVEQAAPNAMTLVKTLHEAGYRTEAIGKVFHRARDNAAAWDRNWPTKFEDYERSMARVADETTLGDTIAIERAKRRLNDLRGLARTPWFLAVGLNRPHLPFIAPEQDWKVYDNRPRLRRYIANGQIDAPPWALLSYSLYLYEDLAAYKPPQFYDRSVLPTNVDQDLVTGYLASVTYIDRLIGDLLAELDRQGLADNTIVILWGDNGYKLGDYGHWGKSSNANIDIRVPLIIRAPGYSVPGSRPHGIVESIDIYPTLLHMAGLPNQPQLEGQNFQRLLKDPKFPWKEAAFAQFEQRYPGRGDISGRTVRTARWRYTAWVQEQGIVAQELYDLVADPGESTNLAYKSDYANVRKRMEEMRQEGWLPVRNELRTRLYR